MSHQHGMGQPGALALLAAGSALCAGIAYGWAAARLRRRGDRWPPLRDLWWAAGSAVVVAAALFPFPGGPFGAHMGRHLAEGMVAPLLLVLARPVTLGLRSLPPGGRRRLLAMVRSRPLGVLAHPLVAAALDAGGLWLLYRTPLFALAHERPWVGHLVHAHVLAAGLLFSAAVCSLDPLPRHGMVVRAAALVGAGAAHSVLSRTLYAASPPGTGFAPGDLSAAAELMYYGGDLVEIALAAVVGFQWYAASGRRLARESWRGAMTRRPPASAPYRQ
ncbi:cytochrome c oxidase assembly protein [Streptomyces sp. NPDC006530]|uniref:cytochrome c oxidase assembly protein n=1 Tax=Streptomyces sp. NPDC006530 TaxID=3364750 RepID=UPI0036A4A9D4